MAGMRVVSRTYMVDLRNATERSGNCTLEVAQLGLHRAHPAVELALGTELREVVGAQMCLSKAPEISLASEAKGHYWATMARVITSGSVSKAGRPALGGSEECSSFHQSSTTTYNETKKESRSSMAPSFGESLVHQHTILAPSPFFAITHQTS